jgi:large subunit ribosomal protein L24e
MVKCSFCGREEHESKGVNVIHNDGNVSYFCSKKCRMNALKLKRDKRKIRWSEAFHEKREKARAKEAEKAKK